MAAVSSRICRDSCIVNTTIFAGAGAFRISRAASRPPRFGIVTSRITRSGFSSAAFWIASRPSTASPQTTHPAPMRAAFRPRRTASWSSAIRIRKDFLISSPSLWPAGTVLQRTGSLAPPVKATDPPSNRSADWPFAGESAASPAGFRSAGQKVKHVKLAPLRTSATSNSNRPVASRKFLAHFSENVTLNPE
jgi:hypothetical protein